MYIVEMYLTVDYHVINNKASLKNLLPNRYEGSSSVKNVKMQQSTINALPA